MNLRQLNLKRDDRPLDAIDFTGGSQGTRLQHDGTAPKPVEGPYRVRHPPSVSARFDLLVGAASAQRHDVAGVASDWSVHERLESVRFPVAHPNIDSIILRRAARGKPCRLCVGTSPSSSSYWLAAGQRIAVHDGLAVGEPPLPRVERPDVVVGRVAPQDRRRPPVPAPGTTRRTGSGSARRRPARLARCRSGGSAPRGTRSRRCAPSPATMPAMISSRPRDRAISRRPSGPPW